MICSSLHTIFVLSKTNDILLKLNVLSHVSLLNASEKVRDLTKFGQPLYVCIHCIYDGNLLCKLFIHSLDVNIEGCASPD